MAGDWIKMRTNLRTHPKVVRIASALKADRLRVIGGLHAVWCLFDAHSADGCLEGYSADTLDEDIGWPGFSAAMIKVEWLLDDGDSLSTPRFDEHNGQSAKRRAQETERKRNERKVSAKVSASDADKKRTREEKRREDIKPPIPPEGGDQEEGDDEPKRKAAISLKTYLDDCRKTGVKAIPEGHAVFAYAGKVGIPDEFLRLQWLEFRDRYTMPEAKRYKSWATVFHKATKGNWFKLWFVGADGQYALTTVGQQAQRSHQEAA